MDITLTLREKSDRDYYVEGHVTGGCIYGGRVQSSGTHVAANITLESWPSVKDFIDQQFVAQAQMICPPCNTEGDS